jgi:hypothetical protein
VRLKRVPYSIDIQCSSSAAACSDASPTYGARQPRVIHHCKQHRIEARVRPFSDEKHRLHFGSLTNSGVLSSVLGRFRTFFETRGKNEDPCRNRFARDAQQRRVDVARRRRGGRSIAHTVSPCGSANPRCVWSTKPHIFRRSCAVSLQRRALKTAGRCFEPDVLAFRHNAHSRSS